MIMGANAWAEANRAAITKAVFIIMAVVCVLILCKAWSISDSVRRNTVCILAFYCCSLHEKPLTMTTARCSELSSLFVSTNHITPFHRLRILDEKYANANQSDSKDMEVRVQAGGNSFRR
jgi:hypothetical protein